MGSPSSETGRGNDETQHQVTLTNGFYLGKYEVTQAQYQTVMNGNPEGLSADPSAFLRKQPPSGKSFLGGCSNLSHATQCHRADRWSIAQRMEICPAYGGSMGICLPCGHDHGVLVGQ